MNSKLIIVLASLILVLSASPSLARRGQGGQNGQGRLPFTTLQNENAGKYLDVKESGIRNGTQVQVWSHSGGRNQQWRFVPLGRGWYLIQDRNSGKCLDVRGASNRNGAPVQIWDCTKAANQRWRVEPLARGWAQIRNQGSGKCLDVRDKSMDNGAPVQQWDCSRGYNQRWRVPRSMLSSGQGRRGAGQGPGRKMQ